MKTSPPGQTEVHAPRPPSAASSPRTAAMRTGLAVSILAVVAALKCTSTPTRLIEPAQRQPAPDAVVVDVSSGEDVKLSSFKGQVVLLDFWATWCPPCQAPMAHNAAIMSRRGKDWKGKAVIVGVSIDDDVKAVRRHVTARGWQSVRHLWCKEGGSGWNATAVRAYGITSIPTAFLIDRAGRIAWHGHPAEIDVEQEIDRLLK